MISTLNSLLKPVENFLIKNQKMLGYIILAFALPAFYYAQNYSLSLKGAEMAMFLLVIILWIPIFSRIFGLKIFTALSGFRKELGIIMGILSSIHFYYMFGMLGYYFENNTILFTLGIIPQIIIFLLTITSNDFSKKFLGKNWKRLHRLVYIVPILILLQISLGTGQISLKDGITFWKNFEILPWIVWGWYYIFKIFEWKNIKFFTPEIQNFPKWQKFLCVPCGYIYDPAVGDEEDGIPAGTEFVDIPDTWRCPDCGVTKVDFIPWNEGNETGSISVKILEKIFLNPTTIELILELPEEKTSKIWQFATFEYEDENWKFRRQYSVSKQNGKIIHFLIKIKKDGRGGKILQKISAGETMNFIGFFGDFILQETKNEKIFIATGTGLAPIYRMMNAIPNISKKLYISVATKDEIFYKNELDAIPNAQIEYFVSRECVDGFCQGRIDFEKIICNEKSEIYLCGNPKMIEDFVSKFREKGIEKIYFEEFVV